MLKNLLAAGAGNKGKGKMRRGGAKTLSKRGKREKMGVDGNRDGNAFGNPHEAD
jgi:hypothetical protein